MFVVLEYNSNEWGIYALTVVGVIVDVGRSVGEDSRWWDDGLFLIGSE